MSLDTTNRYAEISLKMREAALRLCEASVNSTSPDYPEQQFGETTHRSWLGSNRPNDCVAETEPASQATLAAEGARHAAG